MQCECCTLQLPAHWTTEETFQTLQRTLLKVKLKWKSVCTVCANTWFQMFST
jgi:hypothetical protein